MAGPLIPTRGTCFCWVMAAAAATLSNRYVFKYHLESLANRVGLEIRVAHYPPHCSKYNPSGHRFFAHVMRACQGLLLTSIEVTSHGTGEHKTGPENNRPRSHR